MSVSGREVGICFFVQWTNQMKDVISLTSKVEREGGMKQHPVKIFETKKVSSSTKTFGCWSMPRDEMWVWSSATTIRAAEQPVGARKNAKTMKPYLVQSFKYRNGQPRLPKNTHILCIYSQSVLINEKKVLILSAF